MKRNAFSLIELVIVLSILAVGIQLSITSYKTTSAKSSTVSNTQDFSAINKSIQAYVDIHKKLPRSDSDGDGVGDSSGYGFLPYVDLNIKSLDRYGFVYRYDVAANLETTNSATICTELNATSVEPYYINELSTQYSVAAVVVSIGENNSLDTGTNRIYNTLTDDDKLLEINTSVLYNRVCNWG